LENIGFFGIAQFYMTKSLNKKAELPIHFGNPAI
jgi:hypothetical protein